MIHGHRTGSGEEILRSVFIPMFLSVLLIACAPAEQPSADNPSVKSSQKQNGSHENSASPARLIRAQMIIKFKSDLDSSQVSSRLEQMSREYSVAIRLLREMSGGAFVIEATEVADAKRLNALLESIRKRDDVAYIEMDARMSHQ